MAKPRLFKVVVLSIILSGSPAALASVNMNDIILLLANSKQLQLNSPTSSFRQAIVSFLQNFSGDNRFALLTFDEHTSLILTFMPVEPQGVEKLLKPLDRIQPIRSHSNSAAAMERAIEIFNKSSRSEASKSIVFITDNRINTGDKTRDLQFTRWLRELLSEEAAAAGIRIHGIAYSETADVQSIEALTKSTGGHYARASSASDLKTAFDMLATAIANRQRPVETSPLASVSQALYKPEKLPRAETTAVAAQQELALPPQTQSSEVFQQRVEPSLQTQADRHDTQSGGIVIKEFKPQMPSLTLVTSWISSNKMLLTTLITAVVAILLGLFLVLRHRKRSSIFSQERHSVANTVPPAHLEDMSEVTNQRVYDISGKLTRIRRAPAIDTNKVKNIVIKDHLISRDHALIEYEDYGYWISDHSSANGTFVNDEKITDKKLLNYGDRIRFAKYEFKFAMPPQTATSETMALSPFSNERHPTQSDETTLTAAGRSTLLESDETPQPRYGEEHRPFVRTSHLNPADHQDYEPAAAGSFKSPDETAASQTSTSSEIPKRPVKDPGMATHTPSFEADDHSTDAEIKYISGGTAKQPEYHQGDTVMFRRSGDKRGKKDIDTGYGDDKSPAKLRKTDTTEAAEETSEKPAYPRGGTKLYRQPEHEAPMDFGIYPHKPKSESGQMNEDYLKKDQSESPQHGRSDTVAISREQMQQILRYKQHQAKTHRVSADTVQDDIEKALNKLSKSDHVKPALSSEGDIEKAMSITQSNDAAQSEFSAMRTDRELTRDDQQKPFNRSERAAIAIEDTEKRSGSSYSKNETYNASTNTTTPSQDDTGEVIGELSDRDSSDLKYHQEKPYDAAQEQPQQQKASEDLTHSGATESTFEGQAQYDRGDTVAIPHEEIERMVELAKREDKGSSPPAHVVSDDVDESITNLTEHNHDRGDTEELWIGQINEKANSIHSTRSESSIKSHDTSLTADQTEIQTRRSPSSSDTQQDHDQSDFEQTAAVSPSTNKIEKTVIIPRVEHNDSLASNRHQAATDEEETDKIKKRPFRSDK